MSYFINSIQPWLSGTDLPIAQRVAKLTWIVPPDLEEVSGEAGWGDKNGPSIDLVVRATGVRRHGTEILKYLGDRLGPYQLFPAQPFEVRALRIEEEGVSYDRAEELIGYCVAVWNNARLRDQNALANFPSDLRLRQIAQIVGEVSDIFHPVFEAVHSQVMKVTRRKLSCASELISPRDKLRYDAFDHCWAG